ncbi:unnamed protein product, partial [Owenia fusiformis]
MERFQMRISVVCIVFVVLTQYVGAAYVEGNCTSTSDCPTDATCIARGCDGSVCVCNTGFFPSENKTGCEGVVGLDEVCIGKQCLPANSHCSSTDNVCTCDEGYELSYDEEKCRQEPSANGLSFRLLNEPCNEASLAYCSGLFQDCVSGTCKCKEGYREATTADIYLEPSNTFECRLDVHIMNNTNITCPTPPPIMKIYEECESKANCVPNADCTPRGCDGKVCLCELGFLSNDANDLCLGVTEIGMGCNDTIRCPGGSTVCIEGICECKEGYVKVDHRRCKEDISNIHPYTWSLLGEDCKEDGLNRKICQDFMEQECNATGTCVCSKGYRETTEEEKALSPFVDIDCVENDYNANIPDNDKACTTPTTVTTTTATVATTTTLGATTAEAEVTTLGATTAEADVTTIGATTADADVTTIGATTADADVTTIGATTADADVTTIGATTAEADITSIGATTADADVTTLGVTTAEADITIIG